MRKRTTWGLLAIALLFSSLCVGQASEDDKEMRWFSIESLNAGLDTPPEEVNRLTPRDSVRSFLELTKQQDFSAAAHLLNLSELGAAEQREKGPELARRKERKIRIRGKKEGEEGGAGDEEELISARSAEILPTNVFFFPNQKKDLVLS